MIIEPCMIDGYQNDRPAKMVFVSHEVLRETDLPLKTMSVMGVGEGKYGTYDYVPYVGLIIVSD